MRWVCEPFCCRSLTTSARDMLDIENFAVPHEDTGQGLVDYLQECAQNDETMGAMRTYLVRFRKTNECVGYFSLKAGLVSLGEMECESGVVFDTLPGVELANFAVNKSFVQKYHFPGIGELIFTHFILPIIRSAAEYVGVCLVYLFSLPYPELMKRYEKYGFHRLTLDAEEKLHHRLKPVYDQTCIFMCQPLFHLK